MTVPAVWTRQMTGSSAGPATIHSVAAAAAHTAAMTAAGYTAMTVTVAAADSDCSFYITLPAGIPDSFTNENI